MASENLGPLEQQKGWPGGQWAAGEQAKWLLNLNLNDQADQRQQDAPGDVKPDSSA